MRLLDFLASGAKKVLGFLPDPAVEVLWFPLFALALIIVLRIVVRRGIPAVGRMAEGLSSAVVAVAAFPLMAILVVAAAPFREFRVSPPTLLFSLDDALVSVATSTVNAAKKAAGLTQKAASAHFLLIVLLTALLVWRWDTGHCTQTGDSCVRPVLRWGQAVGIDWGSNAGQPAPTPSGSPTPTTPAR